MSKRVYVSADYDPLYGDQVVVNELKRWSADNLHKVEFIDMAQVATGSVSDGDNCRICDLKNEFNKQINASSAVIFIVGDKTARRQAGTLCERASKVQEQCLCTPYKNNANGSRKCKVDSIGVAGVYDDFGCINNYSYLRHEFEQAKKRRKHIIILYISTRYETSWFPLYMNGYQSIARPFWKKNDSGELVGDYAYIKEALGF